MLEIADTGVFFTAFKGILFVITEQGAVELFSAVKAVNRRVCKEIPPLAFRLINNGKVSGCLEHLKKSFTSFHLFF